jgi:hypothetical protein
VRPLLLLLVALCSSGCGGCVDPGSSGQEPAAKPTTASGPVQVRPGFVPIQPRLLQLATDGAVPDQ